ncbi:MarR family transcriptional regulator [Bifidobacterium ramosum]|uniref:MarR family transcriptional regulator n=1 Tax=Bifidobacterium ramosum TaxID=1798158 RepID=A0A6L4X1X8_9BIFI|nr:MarR family transcriptional regulator [Bifidobacterium ramosum]
MPVSWSDDGGVNIMVKRIYDEPESGDGYRVPVDRLWSRGMSKERAALDLWMKDIAPSPGLRKWFGHDPVRFDEFAE